MYYNCCNLKYMMKKNCNIISDVFFIFFKKYVCFMVFDNDFDIKKCLILISLRFVDYVLYIFNIYK